MKPFVRLLFSFCILAGCGVSEWLTFGGDAQRTGWAQKETILSRETVPTLELKWKLQLDNVPKELNSLLPPIVDDQVKTDRGIKEYVVVAGSSDNLYVIDADSGKLVWKKTFLPSVKPAATPNTLCPLSANATPVIQSGRTKTIHIISSDGQLHSLNAVNGEDRFPPVPFVPSFSKNWSLNLADGVLYTALSQRCNGVMSGVYSLDLNDPARSVHSFQVGRAGIWGRGGISVSSASGKVFAETGDGPFSPAAGNYSDSFLELSTKELRLLDYYTPSNREWLTRKDLDMGCMTPSIFYFQKKEYLVGGGKEGRLFLLDTTALGGETHRQPMVRTPLLTNEDVAYAAHGFWGSFATWQDAKSLRWLYAPAWGPPHSTANFPMADGEAKHGSIMAFRVEDKNGSPAITPAWISRDLNVPEPPVVANGVVLALSSGEDVGQADANGNSMGTTERLRGSSHAVLYAFNSETGKQLYSSGDLIKSFTHFGGLAVSNGRIFVTTYEGMVYAFGVGNEER